MVAAERCSGDHFCLGATDPICFILYLTYTCILGKKKQQLTDRNQEGKNQGLTYPLLQVCSFTGSSSRQDTRVSEAGLQQRADDKKEQDASNDGNGQSQVMSQEGAAEKKQQAFK